MKKILMILSVLLMAVVISCDGGSTAKGSLQITVTNDQTAGTLLVGVYDSLASMLSASALPTYNNGAMGDAATADEEVVITIPDMKVGDYYVTVILEEDSLGATGYGDPCSTTSAPYFIHPGVTFTQAGSGSATAVTITEDSLTTITAAINDVQTTPCAK